MSRSRNKNPFHPICGGDSSMNKWKKMANRVVRRSDAEEIPDGKYYKRLLDNWGSPRDGNQIYCPEDPKILRK